MTTIRITTKGYPARITVKHEYKGACGVISETETYDMMRWRELDLDIVQGRAVHCEELTEEGWVPKPILPTKPAPDTE